MPRIHVYIPIRFINESDIATLTLSADGLISRNREIVKASPNLAVALARIVSQIVYRLASERYREGEGEIIMTIELTKEELEAVQAYAANIKFNINSAIRYYRRLLTENRARNKASVEARLAALYVWRIIVEQIAEEVA